MTTAWTKVRVALFGLGLLALAFSVGRRAFQLQVREAAQLRGWAENNYLRDIQIAPRRGRILDRKGHELATTADLDSIFCNPRQLAHVPDGSRELAKALHLDVRELDKSLAAKKELYFAWVKRRVTPEESRAVAALELPGVGMRKEPRRVYPSGTLAATVVGHAGLDGRGLEGVELGFDAALQGTGMELVGVHDRLGRDLLVDGAIDSSSSAGKDLVLSLDRYLTYETERVLAETVRKHNAKAGMSVMLDPHTGEILAMASVPTYNPNDPADAIKRGARNRTITDAFEPGSTLKTFTFAAALDAGKVKPEDRFDCQMGKLMVGKFRIRDDHPKGVLTAAEVFKHSSNIGTVKIARRLGKQGLWKALDRFGFGRPTWLGLPGERRGILRPVSRWGEIEFATHAFGQGLTVTPVQLAAAFGAIAAHGMYHPPRLALYYVGKDGTKEPVLRQPEAPGDTRVMSERASRTLLGIMQGVTEGGTAKAAAIAGYPVAGKTGTAQKVTNGRYDPSKYLSSFVGIVPANAPRLVIAVMIDEPQKIHYGGVVAAPAFKAIAETALRYLGVAPTAPLVVKGKPASKSEAKAAEAEPDGPGVDEPAAVVAGDEGALDDGALAEQDEAQEARLAPSGAAVLLPDFTGMSMGEAIRAARKAGVGLLPSGGGLAVGQTPKPGAVPAGTLCRVSFQRAGG
ncbi:MAG: transpeptidase family protein [Deltaproteobacteria bacterium]|nr:transpeptidase family protein [Deltaproteobacteria bacterium]